MLVHSERLILSIQGNFYEVAKYLEEKYPNYFVESVENLQFGLSFVTNGFKVTLLKQEAKKE